MKKLLLLGIVCIFLSSCQYEKEAESLKSPCVGADNSPCGPKRPVNPHMMHLYSVKV
jgi:hypothetical protein